MKKSPIDSDCWRKCVCFPSAFLRPKFKPSNEQRLDLYIEDQMTCTIKLVIYVYKRRKVNSVLRKKMGGFLYTQNSIPFFLILCVHFPFEPDFRLLCSRQSDNLSQQLPGNCRKIIELSAVQTIVKISAPKVNKNECKQPARENLVYRFFRSRQKVI